MNAAPSPFIARVTRDVGPVPGAVPGAVPGVIPLVSSPTAPPTDSAARSMTPGTLPVGDAQSGISDRHDLAETADTAAVRRYLLALQSQIVAVLEAFDGEPFRQDVWQKPASSALQGDGITRVIENGAFFERGGCNFSHVRGRSLPASATAGRPILAGRPYEALGVSLVLHPRNPYCPTTHMNVRVFVVPPRPGQDEAPIFWFGGGMDLTPFYGFEDDVRHFHRTCAMALAPFGSELYPAFKLWCDAYFHLPHRDEPRGVGGIFFDDFAELGFAGTFAMTRAVGDAFLNAYVPIISRRRAMAYGERERDFQSYRRGRYVEFNLVQDRGTLFGLKGGGRTESILMSLPPLPTWRYDWAPEPGTPEAALYSHFLVPRDWLDDSMLDEVPFAQPSIER